MAATTGKYSHQREAIIRFLADRTDHPTADVVYQQLRSEIPNLSLATVYRNLNRLAESGQILRLHADGKTDHYDACTRPHAHLLCKNCGCVRDVPVACEDGLLERARKISGYEIDGVSVLFSGLCDACAGSADHTD